MSQPQIFSHAYGCYHLLSSFLHQYVIISSPIWSYFSSTLLLSVQFWGPRNQVPLLKGTDAHQGGGFSLPLSLYLYLFTAFMRNFVVVVFLEKRSIHSHCHCKTVGQSLTWLCLSMLGWQQLPSARRRSDWQKSIRLMKTTFGPQSAWQVSAACDHTCIHT